MSTIIERVVSREDDLTTYTCIRCRRPIEGEPLCKFDDAGGRTYYHPGYCLPDGDKDCSTAEATSLRRS